MSFSISLVEDQSLIRAELREALTPEIVTDFFSQLQQQIETHQVTRLLTDASKAIFEIPLEEFGLIPSKMRDGGFPSNIKRAIVVGTEMESFKLWENLLVSEGYYQVKLFWEENKALEWLND